MADLDWMADVLRAAGLPVREIPGWRTRGHGAMGEVLGVLAHHTAGPASGLYPSERVVVDGRPGLEGPLANLGLDRAGTWIVVAAGQAWHAGSGWVPWCPRDQGNSHLIGVEAESTGTTAPNGDWTPEQRESYPRGVAALLAHLGLGSYRAIGHKEWAPTRKIDPAFWDMPAFRAEVARWMDPTTTGDDMPTPAELWAHPVPDNYPGAAYPTLPAFAALGFATARATLALETAARCEDKLDELLAVVAPAGPAAAPALTAADHKAIAAEVLAALDAARPTIVINPVEG